MAISEKLPIVAFGLSATLLVFLLGFADAYYGWWPSSAIRSAIEGAEQIEEDYHLKRHSHPARPGFETGVRRLGSGSLQPGTTLITSLWKEHGGVAGARLIDAEGKVLGHYVTDPFEIWPENPYTDGLKDLFYIQSNYIHGTWLFPDGDLLFNIEYLGLVRMAPDGTVRWKSGRRTHHSIARNEDGNFWVCGLNFRELPTDALQFRGLKLPFVEDLAVLYSPDGEVLKEVSILKALFQNGLDRLISQRLAPDPVADDVTHMNDVEELSAEMADQYPMFEAGDLLVSLRDTHTVLVLDPDTLEIKWFDAAHTIRQHDPDFIGDGWISVFDNNPDGEFNGALRMGTRLLGLRPHTGEVKVIYPEPDPTDLQPFYSTVGGKAELLPNGNWLILEATGGRVVEFDQNGNDLWEYCHEIQDSGLVCEVLGGSRVPYDAATIRSWFAR
ncbi:MAG: arylsulfotransferase family protein [Planctomycetota bacterium]